MGASERKTGRALRSLHLRQLRVRRGRYDLVVVRRQSVVRHRVGTAARHTQCGRLLLALLAARSGGLWVVGREQSPPCDCSCNRRCSDQGFYARHARRASSRTSLLHSLSPSLSFLRLNKGTLGTPAPLPSAEPLPGRIALRAASLVVDHLAALGIHVHVPSVELYFVGDGAAVEVYQPRLLHKR
jgi:hypothetical protein